MSDGKKSHWTEKSVGERGWDQSERQWKDAEEAGKWPLGKLLLISIPIGVLIWAGIIYLIIPA